jgi:hypothetical protein
VTSNIISVAEIIKFEKGEGASLKTHALAGEKSATLAPCYLIIKRDNNSHSGGLVPSLFKDNKL